MDYNKNGKKTFGIIMAGGGGTRFWPLSRRETPKQLLNLSGKDVMVNEAVARLSRVAANEDIYIVTNSAQAEKMRAVTKGRVRAEHILSEPCARNTAACIGYAAMKIMYEKGDGVLVITPSDAYIRDEDAFASVLETAVQAAWETEKLVTIGITPTFPATGYGYIRFRAAEGAVKPVDRFVEKPDRARAEEFLRSGEYVWNSGMFVWKASVILEKFKTLLPELYRGLQKIAASFGSGAEAETLAEVYPALPGISVDNGIMERSGDILVVPGEFGWSDVGSWDMMNVLHPEDERGNIALGDALLLDSSHTTVYAGSRLVAVVGAEGLVVVETPDAVLVCPKDRVQDVKAVVGRLAKEGREELL